jgi:hypothetical protein
LIYLNKKDLIGVLEFYKKGEMKEVFTFGGSMAKENIC